MKKIFAKQSLAKWTKWPLGVGLVAIVAISLILSDSHAQEPAKKNKPANMPAKAEAAKTTPAKTTEAAPAPAPAAATETAGAAVEKPEGLFPEKDFYTRAEVEALRSVLDRKSNQLDQDLEAQKRYLDELKVQVDDQLKKVDAARNEIAEFMNTRDEKEEGKLKKLARFYEAMDAEAASPLFRDLSDDMAIKIFDRMDAKKAGQILALIPPPRAARLTTQFPKLKIQIDKVAGGER